MAERYFSESTVFVVLPELGAFDDISHWVFEPMSHVFALSFTVGATKDAASLDSVFLSHILIVILFIGDRKCGIGINMFAVIEQLF